jgi:hypothetical protein
MTKNLGRRSIRLRGYDCSQHGSYLITICTKNPSLSFEFKEIPSASAGTSVAIRGMGKSIPLLPPIDDRAADATSAYHAGLPMRTR